MDCLDTFCRMPPPPGYMAVPRFDGRTQRAKSRHPCVWPASTRIGGHVMVTFVTTLNEAPSRARISVGQPPLPHQREPVT